MLLPVAYFLLFSAFILRSRLYRDGNISPVLLIPVFILKIAAGLFLGYIYRKYFNGGDCISYFDSACFLFDELKNHPILFIKMILGVEDPMLNDLYLRAGNWNSEGFFYADTHAVIRINALIRLVSWGHYTVHVIFFCFLSLTGAHLLFKTFRKFVPGKEKLLFAFMHLIPSVLFWSSGILKEGLVIFFTGLLLYSISQSFSGMKIKFITALFVSACGLVFVKPYVLAALLPGIISWFWCEKSGNKKVVMKFLSIHALLLIILLTPALFNKNPDVVHIIHSQQVNSVKYSSYFGARSIIAPPSFEKNIFSFLLTVPAAFANAFFIPLLPPYHNPFAALAAMENIFVILLMSLSILFPKNIPVSSLPVLLMSVSFIILLYVLIGFTTANAGTLVRYKVPALPIMGFVMVMLFDTNKFLRFYYGSRSDL